MPDHMAAAADALAEVVDDFLYMGELFVPYRHDGDLGCASNDNIKNPCDCGTQKLVEALRAYRIAKHKKPFSTEENIEAEKSGQPKTGTQTGVQTRQHYGLG